MHHLQNIPAFKFASILIVGILIGSEIHVQSIMLIYLELLLLILIFVFNKKEKQNLIFMLSCALILFFGIFKSNIDFFYFPDNSIKYFSDTGKNIKVKLRGIVCDIPDYDSNRVRFIMHSREVISGNDTIEVSGDLISDIRKDIYKKINLIIPEIEPGDEVMLTGKLSEAPGKRNPGEFDYKKYLEINNIHKIFFVTGYDNIELISKDNLDFFYGNIIFPAKYFALHNIDENYEGDESAYLKGLVTGERSNISNEMKESFVNAGVMHLIAVSGLNVAYIIISLTLILSLFRMRLLPRTLIIIIFLIFYCFFTGNSPSIVRASIMGILVLIAFFLERKINFFNAIGIALMGILIYDSKQLFDPGFILSFTAIISMAVFVNVFENLFLKKLRVQKSKIKKFLLWTSALFFTTLAAQIGTLPVTVIYFEKISIVSLIANIIAVPLANLSLAIGFFQILTAIFSGYLSSVISEVNNLLLTVQILFIKLCAEWKFAYFELSKIDLRDIIFYYLFLIFLVAIKSKYIFKIIISILMFGGIFLLKSDLNPKLKVSFLDIGQGDCSLIQTPDGKTILVDCGRVSYNFDSGERTIAPYLKRNGISKIDLLILTHLHNDHIGGVNYILDNFGIGKILESGQKVNSSLIKKMDSLIISKNINREVIRAGDLIDEMNNMRLYFFFPTNKFVNENGYTSDNNLNNGSVVFILKYNESEFLFTGDVEEAGEKFLSDAYSDFLKTDVLKVAHHGSITSTSIPFIIKNKPVYAVISCGMFNKFNHPSDVVLNRLEKTGTSTFRTDLDAAVIMESDGYEINIVDWK